MVEKENERKNKMNKSNEIEIKKLTDLINDIKTAVDNSYFGPMFIYPNETDFTDKQVNQLAWTLYLHLITPIMKEYTGGDE